MRDEGLRTKGIQDSGFKIQGLSEHEFHELHELIFNSENIEKNKNIENPF